MNMVMKTITCMRLGKLAGIALAVGLALNTSPASAGHVVAYVLTDHLGSPSIEMDMSGRIIKREVYGPYGQAQISPNNGGIGYTGHMQDGDTGLIYMQARYFDPESIRFLSTDPVRFSPGQPNHFNPYWYAEGNPYKYTDPDGCETGTAFKVLNELANGGKSIVPPPRSPDDWLGPAIGYTLTAAIAAPVAVELYVAALSNPGTVVTATELTAEAAGVTGGATFAGGTIRGATKFANPAFAAQLEKQFAKDGSKSIFKSLGSLEDRLAAHEAKLPNLQYKSSVEREIRTFKDQIKTLNQFIEKHGLKQ